MKHVEDFLSDEQIEALRLSVLDALDGWALEHLPQSNGHGWNDGDLPHLFPSLSEHASRLVLRFKRDSY